MANRWFPKVRSWLALGAPLELLSPLSVARIIALVAVVTWPVGMLTGATTLAVGSVLLAASVAVTVLLMRVRVVDDEYSPLLLLTFGAMSIASISTSGGEHRAVLLSALLGTMAIFAGLFMKPSVLFPSLLIGVGSLAVVLRFTHDGMGMSNGTIMCLFAFLIATTTAMTARTARTSGLLDPETGLANFRGLADRLERRDPDRDLIVATVNLNGVAEVRDALGHHAGSELVRRAVEDLGQVMTAGVAIGRGASDDVVILVENRSELGVSTTALVDHVVQEIAAAIGSGRYLVGDIEVTLNAHVGVAISPARQNADDDPGPIELLRQAGLAAHAARGAGRLVAVWDGESTTLTVDDLELLADLRTAADRGELWLAYQPQVSAPDGRIISVEALLRWTSERHGVVSPGRFIPLAERTGLVDRLTDWVLGEALDAQARWREQGVDLTVSVNVSPLSLRSVDFGDRVEAALAARGLPPGVLMLEVTESMAFDIPEAVERLGPLRASGVRVSIDDFGTGYTSLAVLPQLPLDELKVDQMFVRDAMTSRASEAIVRSVCELGHRLGLTVVAEGVEDELLADLMTSFGVDLLQGYHFARPMPEDDLVAMIELESCSPLFAADAIEAADLVSPSDARR
ncbi:putative bifunctional diguanylate cyclase/phosphodiesterase [Ilumatobacter coccineus]|uniref:EAL domain-containing protein n=1 Tax=Ilumatobacter coccineus (strain NBRC 103263 / KCTC 29153 / YM16-304) TaxID=1313172 RepID=A0A6C7EEH8_ILUCY|nr:GGDEF domain-containing phosphodiesterase [Ilumatobacter coccineus]BAN03038.1 hypothetical protein YM304_27240 [Ilumatobacter coccineus YM16-304]